jgi:hypothetical protein
MSKDYYISLETLLEYLERFGAETLKANEFPERERIIVANTCATIIEDLIAFTKSRQIPTASLDANFQIGPDPKAN